MILQPKSNNLPDTADQNGGEPVVSAGLNMVPGNENAAMAQKASDGEDKRREAGADGVAKLTPTPQQENKTPVKEEKPVLGQHQPGKPSRTDNCHCPEVSRP